MEITTRAAALAGAASGDELWRRRHWFLGLGALLMAAGVAAVAFAFTSTLVSAVFVGVLLLGAGIAHAAHALRFWRRGWAVFLPSLVLAGLYAAAGVLLLARPWTAALALTLVVAVAMVAAGTLRLVSAAAGWTRERGLAAAHGVLTLGMGVLVWAQWPATGAWVIGAFLGVDLVLGGWAFVLLGLSAREFAPPDPGS